MQRPFRVTLARSLALFPRQKMEKPLEAPRALDFASSQKSGSNGREENMGQGEDGKWVSHRSFRVTQAPAMTRTAFRTARLGVRGVKKGRSRREILQALTILGARRVCVFFQWTRNCDSTIRITYTTHSPRRDHRKPIVFHWARHVRWLWEGPSCPFQLTQVIQAATGNDKCHGHSEGSQSQFSAPETNTFESQVKTGFDPLIVPLLIVVSSTLLSLQVFLEWKKFRR